jgi:hypothetical protein
VKKLDNSRKIDFGMKLKSRGFNRLVKDLFNRMPDVPKQKTYRDRLRQCLRIILINLIDMAPFSDGVVSYSRNTHSPEYKLINYSAQNISKGVDFLGNEGLTENRLGYFSQDRDRCRMSRMRVTKELINLFDEYDIKQVEIMEEKKTDLIILRNELKQPIHFQDTEFTLSATKKLQKINDLLSSHNIVIGPDYNIHRKYLHRVFNFDFNHGGRFFGSDWQRLNSSKRQLIKIDNSPVIELDFKSLHPTMLYALKGIQLESDAYKLKGYSSEIRAFLKTVMLIRINTESDERAIRAIQGLINQRKIGKPSEVNSLKKLIQAYMEKHGPIRDLFDNDTGLKLQRLDSDICEAVLMEFYEKDIPVLSVHDSFIVSKDYEPELFQAMERVFFNKFNKKCDISKKREKKF